MAERRGALASTARRALWRGPASSTTLLVLLAACAPDFTGPSRLMGQSIPPPRDPIVDRRRTYFDSAATQLSRERGVLILHDNSLLAHGRDVSYYSSGLPRFEREFDHGEPRGRWRSWYESGALESDATYTPGVPTTMTWRREDGSLSSSGEHVLGAREGEWLWRHPNGMLAARGSYSRGQRDGLWSYWSDTGELIECGWFVDDERSGAWERGPAFSGATAR